MIRPLENIPRLRRHWQSSGFVTPPTLRKTLQEQDRELENRGKIGQEQVTESLLQLLRRKRSTDHNITDAFAFNVTEYCQNVSGNTEGNPLERKTYKNGKAVGGLTVIYATITLTHICALNFAWGLLYN